MGIFAKYKTFFVEFLVLILFGWILMEYQTSYSENRFERFDTEFLPQEDYDLVNYKTLFFTLDPKISGMNTLMMPDITVENERFGEMYYKTTFFFGLHGNLEFVGYVENKLNIWITLRESFFDIKTNHQRNQKGNFSIPNVQDAKRINMKFGDRKTIQIQRNRRFIIG